MPNPSRTTVLALLSLAGFATSMLSCSAAGERSGTTDSYRANRAESPSLARLESLAATQRKRAAPVDVPPPPGLAAGVVLPIDPVPPEAMASLSDLLPELAAGIPVTPPPASLADADATTEALRLYARARSAANNNQMPSALSMLDDAVKADPGRPEIWRLRGDILASTGQRLPALTAYQRVLDLGLIEPRACLALGIAASDRSDKENAARYLAGAVLHHPEGEDPALAIVAHAALGPVLHNLGRLRAGNEAIERAVTSSLQFTATTSYRPDLQTLARKRSDLARGAGDAWARLGDTERALEAYGQAALLPSFDPSAITVRRVYILAHAGRPAESALVLLDDVAASALRVDDRQLSLFSYLASCTDLGPVLADALAELPAYTRDRAEALGAPAPIITPTIEGRLARAAAAIHPPSAREALERHLIANPEDAEAARDWTRQLDASNARTAAASLLERQPLLIGPLSEAISRSPAWAWMMNGSADSQALSMLVAGVRAAQGEYAESGRVLRASPDSHVERVAAAHALCAGEIGDFEIAETLLQSITDPALRARVLLAMQRPADAQAALRSTSESEPSVAELSLAAAVAIESRDAASAESLLKRAIEADPFDETLYDRLAALYRPGSPIADQDRLFGVYRDLRTAVPSSRLLRILNAQDAAQRGSLSQAEAELISLVEQDPDDARALQVLLAVWQRRLRDDATVVARAEEFLGSLHEQNPASPSLAIARAQLLAVAGRGSDAESLLMAQRQAAPSREVDKAWESLLRDPLARGAEADELAIIRLSPLPRPIDATIELAAVLARTGRLDDAASTLEQQIPPTATLTPMQGSAIQLILADVGPLASAEPDAARTHAVLRMIDVAVARAVVVTPGVHELRVALLASDPDTSAERIIAACADARAHASTLGTRPAKRAIGMLAEAERHAPALQVALAELGASQPVDTELALMGVRLVVLAGEASDLKQVLEALTTLEEAAPVLEPIHPDGPLALDQTSTLAHARAEIAFMVGNYLTVSEDRKEAGGDMYRLALSFEPTHAMAANNLGYTLLERDRNREEANALLEAAYRNAPDDPNVVDSIGWLRYQQGRIADTANPDGSTTEGAITLLEKALILDSDGGSPVSMDHFADALWAGGRTDEAIFQWEQALTDLELEMTDAGSGGRTDPDHPALMQSIRAKLEAARTGGQPQIAPQRWAPATTMPTASSSVPTPAQPSER